MRSQYTSLHSVHTDQLDMYRVIYTLYSTSDQLRDVYLT